MTKISRTESDRLYRVVGNILQLPVQLHIANEAVISHIFCATQNFKEKRFELVMGLNDPEPSATIRHLAAQGQLVCMWEGHQFKQGPEFYPDDNETDLESYEVPEYDTYLTFYVELE